MAGEKLIPMMYVCVVSQFNLPQFEACLARRPSDVVLIVSDFTPARDGAENLSNLLGKAMPSITVHRPDEQHGVQILKGDDAVEAQRWIFSVLVPYLDTNKEDKKVWLNLTGGTKAISLALVTGYSWDMLDYKSFGNASLQSFSLNHNAIPGPEVIQHDNFTILPKITPKQVALIYNKEVRERPENPLRRHTESVWLAKRIFDALSQSNETLNLIFSGLNRIWSEQRDQHKYPQWHQPLLTLSLHEFLGKPATEWPGDLTNWLDVLSTLSDECLIYTNSSITIPGNKINGKRHKHLKIYKDWLSGDWLEQLVGIWLKSAGIPDEDIAYGLMAGSNGYADNSREADILIHHSGRTYVIEVKADLPSGSRAQQSEHQLTSMARIYGQTRRILLVGPEFRHTLKNHNDWDDFVRRCNYNGVAVCWDKNTLQSCILQ